ncbi:putative holin-like toxin [Aquibacillus koreensis]|uniref:Holin-like toxin n=1 Tax=Aquibacillus koreensis TaxID=279446 RepID=A0A9X3WKX7_9BACI|nr:putative holin-like toxin [Aquibacillus koreensis]MCT2536861.1 putative holin-like toxin [Aquibacillus koreensis]MDC3422007.1 putative holin-like toxin [Aquibacillus koreensis]
MSDVQIMIMTGIFIVAFVNLIIVLIDKMNKK